MIFSSWLCVLLYILYLPCTYTDHVYITCFAIYFIQVCTFHDGCKQGIDQQIFNRKSISRKITHPQSLTVATSHHERNAREEQHPYTCSTNKQYKSDSGAWTLVVCCYNAKLCAHAARAFRLQQSGAVTRMSRLCQVQTEKRTCNRCGSLQNGGDVIATSRLVLRWMHCSPRTECVRRTTPIYKRHEQAIIEWLWRMNSIVACCHSVKLCTHAARAFWSQQYLTHQAPVVRKLAQGQATGPQ